MKSVLLMLIGLLLIACGPSKKELDAVKRDKEQINAQLTECKAQLNKRERVITGAYRGTQTLVNVHCFGCKGDLGREIGKTNDRTIYLTEKSDWVYFGSDESCKGRRFNDEVVAHCSTNSSSYHYRLRFENDALHGEITDVFHTASATLTHEYTFVAQNKK